MTRETNINAWDSMDFADPRFTGYRLFGNANIGDLNRTSLSRAGYVGNEEGNTRIYNWYARTNLNVHQFPKADTAFSDWAHAAVATLRIGEMEENWWRLPVSDLLKRGGGMPGLITSVRGAGTEETMQQELAEILALRSATRDAVNWMEVAGNAMKVLGRSVCVPIPKRQQVFVEIQSEQYSMNRLFEVMPKDVHPKPLLWVHIEGIHSV